MLIFLTSINLELVDQNYFRLPILRTFSGDRKITLHHTVSHLILTCLIINKSDKVERNEINVKSVCTLLLGLEECKSEQWLMKLRWVIFLTVSVKTNDLLTWTGCTARDLIITAEINRLDPHTKQQDLNLFYYFFTIFLWEFTLILSSVLHSKHSVSLKSICIL